VNTSLLDEPYSKGALTRRQAALQDEINVFILGVKKINLLIKKLIKN
jgi:hypothetical protein